MFKFLSCTVIAFSITMNCSYSALALEEEHEDIDFVNISDINDAEAYPNGEYVNQESDDFEGFNRAMFGFNEFLDALLFKPVAHVYETVVPSFARDRVRSVLSNLHEPVYFVNHVLQGEPEKAADTMGRFLTNSTFGLLGFMDIASAANVKPKPTDFGLTLKKAGVQKGPYLVLPILGPSTLRDASALAVDMAMDPWGYYKFHHVKRHKLVRNRALGIRYSVELVDKRQRLLKVLDQIEKTSLDKYSTIRSMYLQKR
ncbi:MAG: mlaA [Candidatus Midichloriaceae bacterium]|jgi:phospholipid-binding lipoprotein MlaA|nr:mlaA [Candidatus Midichloriaceae bacterium]